MLKHKPDKLGQCPIYLRLTDSNKQKYIPTEVKCRVEEWDEEKQVIKSRADRIKLNLELGEIRNSKESKYNNLNLDRRNTISIAEFLELFVKKKGYSGSKDFFEQIDMRINDLVKTGSVSTISTARYYKDCRNSVKTFVNAEKLSLELITVEWLKKYEQYQKINKIKESSISVKMRAIRTIFNSAIANKIISPDIYPFSRNKQEHNYKYNISSLNTNTQYRAISLDDVTKIKNLDVNKYPDLRLTKDLFLFSYYTAGMNYADMIQLTKKDITKDNRIRYTRSKTGKTFNVPILEPTMEIINFYLKFNIKTKYLFPILLSDNLSSQQIFNRKMKTITKFNKDLKEIGRLCDIDFDLTSYVARHTFASNLKQKGVSTDAISELLGHTDMKVTQVYLKKFEDETTDNAMKHLV